MVADFHAHYPMHLIPGFEGSVGDLITSPGARARLLDRARAWLVHSAGRLANYESLSSGPRVTVPGMVDGQVGVVLSVLYSPFDEMDLTKRYGSPPDPRYFPTLMRQLEAVEGHVAERHPGRAVVARTPAEMDSAVAGGKLAIIHCVEGGFHLGATPQDVERNVAELARRGVAYITLAHLFWRSVATNTPAIPFIPDRMYKLLFPQPDVGLSPLGEAAVRAMVEHRVLIDLSHMDRAALESTFALLDRLDPERSVPVAATHVGYRFGRQEYNLTAPTIARIAERGGLVGIILSEHQAADGVRRRHTRTLEQSLEVLCRHVDRIREVTGSHRHTAIGSDLDGYIKPTLAGLGDSSRLGALRPALARRYGEEAAERIGSANLLDLLRRHWRGAPAPA